MSAFNDLKREQLQKDLAFKLKQYEAVKDQLRGNLNPTDKITLEGEAERLEKDIRQLEQDIRLLEEPQTPTPEVAREQAERALVLAQTEAQAAARQPHRATRLINGLPRRYDGTTPFYDRATEQAEIQKAIQNGVRLISIHARAGAGKTGLACKVLGDLEQRADLVTGIVSLTAGELQKQVSLDRILSDFKRLLPEGAFAYQPGDAVSEKTAALLDALRGGRYVLLIDNLESLLDGDDALRDADLQAFLTTVLERGGLTVLVTTRQRPRLPRLLRVQERAIPLDGGLPAEEALLMMRGLDRNSKLPTDDALLKELIEGVGGFPRALEATVGLLADSPTLTLEELLQDKALFEGEVTQHIVEEALKTLPPLMIRVMEALALLGQPVSLAAVEYLLAPYVDWSGMTLREVLNRLIDRRFVSYNTANQRFSLHPLDKEYCEKRIPFGAPDDIDDDPPVYSRYALNARAALFFQSQRKPQQEWKTLADLEPQLSEFEYRVRLGDYDTAASLLSDFDHAYLLLWGHTRLMVALHKRLLGNVKELRLRSAHLGNLGTAYYSLSETHKAIEYYEQALAVAREIGNKSGEGAWLGGLGNAYSDLGDVAKGIGYYEQALAVVREIGDQSSEGAWLGGLGNAYSDLGEGDVAISYYEQALTISREIGDKRGEGTDLGNLGNAYYLLGKVRHAIGYYEQALAIRREIRDKRGEGTDLGNLGNAYSDLGDMARAIGYYEQALAISRETGYKRGESIRLGNLGLVYSDLGDVPKAIEYHEQALAISREISDKLGESADLNNLANAIIQQGDFVAAFTHIGLSLQIAKSIQSPRMQSYAGADMARVHLLQDDLLAAQQAIEAARQHDVPENNHNAAVLHGVITIRLNDPTPAQTAFNDAVTFADALLRQPQAGYEARYARALARAGLSLITNTPLDDAKTDYEAALAQCSAKGVVQRELRLLQELAKAANGEQLAPLIALLRGTLE